jgi:hypothetical protein
VAQGEEPQHLALALGERVGIGTLSLLRIGRDEPRPERRMDVPLARCTARIAPTTSVSAASLRT